MSNDKVKLKEEELKKVAGGTRQIVGFVKIQLPAGVATAAPPVGPALSPYGVNIAEFLDEFNNRTKKDEGLVIPTVITVYNDHSFSFVTKTPPAAVLIKKASGIEKDSPVPNRDKVATITKEDVERIVHGKLGN